MKYLVFLILLAVDWGAPTGESLIELRNLYEDSARKKTANTKLLNLLERMEKDLPLIKGYKGAAVMMEANYLVSPLSKISRFRTGKALIEQAIKSSPDHIELRYIRLTIQTNIPRFLGYSADIEPDKSFLIGKLGVMKDLDLRRRITDYLSISSICTVQEMKTVNVWKNK